MDEEISDEQMNEAMSEEAMADELAKLIGTTPKADTKDNVHTFLMQVASSRDTTKTGFLTSEELGVMPFTERATKELALISSDIVENPFFAAYFEKEAEILTSTSLSRDAKLLELSVVTKKEFSGATQKKVMKENRGWFRKKIPSGIGT